MSIADKPAGASPVVVTKNSYGWTIRIRDEDPATRYMPIEPAEVNKAIRNMQRPGAQTSSK